MAGGGICVFANQKKGDPMRGKTAVVTGAAGGLGRAICGALLRDGWRVFGLDRDADGLAALDGVEGIAVDLMQADAIVGVFAQVGAVDALVNNAGTCFMSEFPEIPAAELEAQMRLNFSAAFHCCQAAVPGMLGREGVKKIVNISSNGAYNFDVFDPPHYRASKAALDTLTKDLARRYARERIAVNSIAPAMTQTPLFEVVSEEVLARAIAAMPHGRAMQPEEVAEWVAFLLSGKGDICSGNVIILNQGRDVR